MPIFEGLEVSGPIDFCSNVISDVTAHLLGGRRNSGHRGALTEDLHGISNREYVLCPRHSQESSTGNRPARSPAIPSHEAAGEALTPAAQSTQADRMRDPSHIDTPLLSHATTALPLITSTLSRSKSFGHRRRGPRGRSEAPWDLPRSAQREQIPAVCSGSPWQVRGVRYSAIEP